MEVAQESSKESDYTEALSSVGSVNDDGWQVSNHPCQVTGEKADRWTMRRGPGPDSALAMRSKEETTTNSPKNPGTMTVEYDFGIDEN